MPSALGGQGTRLVIGSAVSGGERSNGCLDGVVVHAAGRPQTYRARSFVLATGGFASAGLALDSTGKGRETGLDLPGAGPPRPERPPLRPGAFRPPPPPPPRGAGGAGA